MKKITDIITAVLFCIFLFAFGFASVILPDTEISKSERRYLTQFPSLTVKTVSDGTFMKNLDKYLSDQFPMREDFRSIKAVFESLSLRLDCNDIYEYNGYLTSLDVASNDNQIQKAAEKLNKVKDTLLTSNHTAYLAVIPPKNYYISMYDKSHPVADYEKIQTEISHLCSDFTFIDLYDVLELEDYYKTDSHWRQEQIEAGGVPDRIAEAMGTERKETYTAVTDESLNEFRGVYVGQSAIPTKSEKMYYMTSDSIGGAKVSYIGADINENTVYTLSKADGVDMYDIFLGGAVPIVQIENINATTDRELVMFRDSYGSSLAPLLIECFKKITLVDLRYIESDLVREFVDTENADFLFIYSTGVLCNSEMLKVR